MGKSNYKGRKKSNSYNKKRTEKSEEQTLRSRPNDANWYAPNDTMMKLAANFSFASNLGSKFRIETTSAMPFNDIKCSVPGIMKIRTAMAPGIATDNSDPINVAARNVYAYVRHANAGHSNYDCPDLMLYFLMVDSLYAALSWMMRVAGSMRYYNIRNRYQAKGLIESMSVNYDALSIEYADFVQYINMFAMKLGTLAVPANLSYFKRHRWMYGNLFLDENSSKAQIYYYQPFGFYKYHEMSGQDGRGEIEMVKMETNTITFNSLANIRSYFDPLLASVLESEDMNIMSGDILKAYNDIVVVPTISPDYTVIPTYQPEVLEQIHNLRCCSSPKTTSLNPYITQDVSTNTIQFNPELDAPNSATFTAYTKKFVIDLNTEVPDANLVMVACRLADTVKQDANGKFFLNTCGSEFVTRIETYKYAENSSGVWALTAKYFHSFTYISTTIAATPSTTVELDLAAAVGELGAASLAMAFNRCPIRTVGLDIRDNHTTPNTRTSEVYFLGELDNYTVMSWEDKRDMDELALLHMFGVPTLGVQT